jgi:hypothetical protein
LMGSEPSATSGKPIARRPADDSPAKVIARASPQPAYAS